MKVHQQGAVVGEQPQLHFIEDDGTSPTFRIVRPQAVKIVRPIPRLAVANFYNDVSAAGITGDEAHEAVMFSHEWHRKWTADRPSSTPDSTDPLLSNPRAAGCGAKNPSPQENNPLKRMRLPLPAPVPSTDSSVRDSPRPMDLTATPNRVSPAVMEQADAELFKPIPRRICRPKLAASDEYIPPPCAGVPRSIRSTRYPRSGGGSSTPLSLSPITVPSVSSGSLSSRERVILSKEEAYEFIPSMISHPKVRHARIENARDALLGALAASGGGTDSEAFRSSLVVLQEYFAETDIDTRCSSSKDTEGVWLTLTKPTFFGNLGENDSGDPMYTLGRMSFDMFSPTALVCSLQGNFNTVKRVTDRASLGSIPKVLEQEVATGESTLRTYNVVTAFTIEPGSEAYPLAPNKDVQRPIRGIMTTYGYTLPDPEVPNRLSVWLTGGRMEPNDSPEDVAAWKKQFGQHPPKHGLGEYAKLLAVKFLMGAQIDANMNEDGSIGYTFTRPLGGHGMAFVDTLFVDETLRIARGHRGTIFVFTRIPDKS